MWDTDPRLGGHAFGILVLIVTFRRRASLYPHFERSLMLLLVLSEKKRQNDGAILIEDLNSPVLTYAGSAYRIVLLHFYVPTRPAAGALCFTLSVSLYVLMSVS